MFEQQPGWKPGALILLCIQLGFAAKFLIKAKNGALGIVRPKISKQRFKQGWGNPCQFGNQRPVVGRCIFTQGDFRHPGQWLRYAPPGRNLHYGGTRLWQCARTEEKSGRMGVGRVAREGLPRGPYRQIGVDRFKPTLRASTNDALQGGQQFCFNVLQLLRYSRSGVIGLIKRRKLELKSFEVSEPALLWIAGSQLIDRIAHRSRISGMQCSDEGVAQSCIGAV